MTFDLNLWGYETNNKAGSKNKRNNNNTTKAQWDVIFDHTTDHIVFNAVFFFQRILKLP